MIDHSFWRDLRLASGCSCLSLAMRRSRFLCANPPTRIPSICPGAHMGNVQIAPLLGSCPWALGPDLEAGQTARSACHRWNIQQEGHIKASGTCQPLTHSRSPAGQNLDQMEHPAGRKDGRTYQGLDQEGEWCLSATHAALLDRT
jgi:hypothetical protein